MLMEPMRERTRQNRISKSAVLPAPTRGWVVFDNLAAMPAQTAFVLENFFPSPDFVRLRGGSVAWATGMGSTKTVQSLLRYVSGSSEKLFAACDGSIYDVTAGGAVGAAAVSGMTGNDWFSFQMTTSGGEYLLAFNSADDGRLYDGSTWSTTSITGIAETAVSMGWVYRNRVYLVEDGTQSAWYLGTDSIGGAATEFPLTGVFTLGGALLCGATWSTDSGTSLDNLCAFISTEGEVAVYSGSYPGGTDWSLKGVYRIGKPLDLRCTIKAGGDLLVLTDTGIIPLSQAVQLDIAALSSAAVTQPIAPEFRRIAHARSTLTGWSMISLAAENMFIVNCPKLSTEDHLQLVANSISGAWCRFTGWDAVCWSEFNGELFYGTRDGRVMRADYGGADDGEAFTGTMFMSFTDLKAPSLRKSVKLARVNLQASFVPSEKLTIRTDYNYLVPSVPSTSAPPAAQAVWDTAQWDVDVWPSVEAEPFNRWRTVNGLGAMIAPVIQVTVGTTEEIDLRVTSVDLLYEVGEVIG